LAIQSHIRNDVIAKVNYASRIIVARVLSKSFIFRNCGLARERS